jgi:hypothetical protein
VLPVLAVSFLAHDTIDVIHVIAHSGLVLFSFSLPVLAFCSLGFGMIGLGAHAPPDCWSTYPAYPLAHSRAWLCYVLRCAALRCAALRCAVRHTRRRRRASARGQQQNGSKAAERSKHMCRVSESATICREARVTANPRLAPHCGCAVGGRYACVPTRRWAEGAQLSAQNEKVVESCALCRANAFKHRYDLLQGP